MRTLLDLSKKLLSLGATEPGLELRFGAPSPSRDARKPDLQVLAGLRPNPASPEFLNQLRQLAKQLRQLNQYGIGLAARAAYTRKVVGVFYPVAREQAAEHARDGGVPDPEVRQAALDLIAEIAARCADSYKVVFKGLYGKSLKLNGKELTATAFRILELTRFEQKVRALRYQALSGAAWLAVNNVYHAMRLLGKADEPVQTLDPTGAGKTLTDLYIALQIAAKFDLLRWPTAWQSFIEHYAGSTDPGVAIRPDEGEPPSWNIAIAYAYDSAPCRSVRAAAGADPGPSVLVDCEELKHVVVNDTRMFELAKRQHEGIQISSKFSLLSYTDVMSIVKLQMEIFRDERPGVVEDSGVWNAADMRMYIGFRAVYDLLDSVFNPARHQSVGGRLEDELARRSAHLAEDHTTHHETLWSVQTRGEQTVALKTSETQFTTRMRIGSLIAFGIGDDGIRQPGIGVIARIFRPSAKTVIVELEKFGTAAEPVQVTDELAADKPELKGRYTFPAILMRHIGGKAHLLLPPASGLGERAQVILQRSTRRHRVMLGKIEQVTKDFSSFPIG